MIRILSLGAGVQSSALALMIEKGEFKPVQKAIFSDTMHEPMSVYTWLNYLEKQLSFPVEKVRYKNLVEEALRIRRSKKSGKTYFGQLIPFFIKNHSGTKGIAQRKCTRDYKVYPIRRSLKKTSGINGRLPKEPLIELLMGISVDEAHRMKDSEVSYIKHTYPLVEAGITRQDCVKWMLENGYEEPPRSACYFCPYHNDREWIRLKEKEPLEFMKAVSFERSLQKAAENTDAMQGTPFLHSSLTPLETVEFNRARAQLNLFGNECEGMCGL